MAKKSAKKVNKPLAAGEPANRPAIANPGDKQAQDILRKGLNGGVATETQAVIPSAKPAPAAATTKLLLPLAATAPRTAPPDSPKSPEQEARVMDAPKPTATKTVNVDFAFFEPDAKQVLLGANFNDWARNATTMERKEGGRWKTTLSLTPGRYQYKFIVDGQWMPDPLARENVFNEYGTLNSVVEVRARFSVKIAIPVRAVTTPANGSHFGR
jgi:hypothetical protein